MRATLTFTTILALSLILLWQSFPKPEYSFERLVPSDVVALAVITRPPSNLDVFDGSALGQFIDVDIDALRARIPDDVRREISSLLQQDLETAWLLVHGLDRHGDAWRPQFTVVLQPKRLHAELLELRLELLTLKLLGQPRALASDRGGIRIYAGQRPGQFIFRVRMPGFLVLSNSQEGLRKTLLTFAGRSRSLGGSDAFQRVKAHLGLNDGFFLYVNSAEVFPILPEFGYAMNWRATEPHDEFYLVTQSGWLAQGD